MIELNVREINITDYDEIYQLNIEFNPTLSSFSAEKVKERIELITRSTKDKILVCEFDNEVIGYIHGSPYELLFSNSLINVLGFVVKEKFRKIGIGTILLESLESWAKNNGYFGIKILTHPSRISAHRFYERHGYTYTKDQKNYIKSFK